MPNFNFKSTSNAAVYLGDMTYIFFESESKNLDYLLFQGQESSNTAAPYKRQTVFIDGNAVELGDSPQVAAVSYEIGNTYYLRIYYISRGGLLKEFCLDTKNPDNPPEFYNGGLNQKNLAADPKTALTACVQQGGVDQLKVFYKSATLDFFNCAYVVVGAGDWSTREIFNNSD